MVLQPCKGLGALRSNWSHEKRHHAGCCWPNDRPPRPLPYCLHVGGRCSSLVLDMSEWSPLVVIIWLRACQAYVRMESSCSNYMVEGMPGFQRKGAWSPVETAFFRSKRNAQKGRTLVTRAPSLAPPRVLWTPHCWEGVPRSNAMGVSEKEGITMPIHTSHPYPPQTWNIEIHTLPQTIP